MIDTNDTAECKCAKETAPDCSGSAIFELLDDPQNIYKILTCTPLTPGDYYSLNNALGESNIECFYSLFFKESDDSRDAENKLIEALRRNNKCIYYLMGNMGCGKTTFLHHFLDKVASDYVNRIIDFDKAQRAIDEDKLKEILRMSIVDYYFEDNSCRRQKLSELIDFFFNESHIKDVFDSDNEISFHVFNIGTGNSITGNTDYLWESFQFGMSKLSIYDLLDLFFVIEICSQNRWSPYGGKTIVAFDNLDLVDSTDLLEKFHKALYDAKTHLTTYYARQKAGEAMTLKFAFFLVMREYSGAILSDSCQDDAQELFKKDISKVYWRKEIIDKRLNSLRGWIDCSTPEFSNEIKYITHIYKYQSSLTKLYNNNYRRTILAIMGLREEGVTRPLFNKYLELLFKNDERDAPQYYYSGANGIFIHLLMRLFSKQDCLEKIGIVPFARHKPDYSYSVARQILTYLSHGVYREENREFETPHSTYDLYDSLFLDKGLFNKPEDLINTLWSMFQLKNSEMEPSDLSWTNLITFSRINPLSIDTLWTDFRVYQERKLIPSYTETAHETRPYKFTELLIAPAGRAFLRYIAPHYEFFSYRCFSGNGERLFTESPDSYRPLFCFDLTNESSRMGIERIISMVFEQVKKCCIGLDRAYELRNFHVESRDADFEQHYMTYEFYRKTQGSARKVNELHSERIVNFHIGYLEDFREYILDNSAYSENLKLEYNILLTTKIKDYCILITSNRARSFSKTKRDVSVFLEKIKGIEDSEYQDFSTRIELE